MLGLYVFFFKKGHSELNVVVITWQNSYLYSLCWKRGRSLCINHLLKTHTFPFMLMQLLYQLFFFFFFIHFSCCTKVMLLAVVRSFQEPCNKTSHWKCCTLKNVNDVRPELRWAQPLLLWFRGLCCLLWRRPGSLPVITGKSWIVICWRPLVPVNWLYLIAQCGDKSEHRRSSRGATIWKKRTDPHYLLV